MNKSDLLKYVEETSLAMTLGEIDEAILLHFDLMMESYKLKPLFYKKLIKYDRFMVALTLLSFYFSDDRIPLSKVKAFCEKRGYSSRNSLDSYFSFFFITGYMHVRLHDDDARQRVFGPTKEATREAAKIAKSYLLPLQISAPHQACLWCERDLEDILPLFFSGFAKLLHADVLLDKLLPEAKWMLNRDGGHLPMLALYTDSLRRLSENPARKVSTYTELSSCLGVSNTHVIRMVKEGETHGYFKCSKHTVELLPPFISMVRKAMAINFAVTQISLELGIKHSNKDINLYETERPRKL